MSAAQDVTDQTFDSVVLKSQVPVLVDFWAPWCGPCKAMGPSVDKLAGELGAQVKVVKINTDESQEIASSLGVSSIPTFMVFKGGKMVARQMGAMPYDRLKTLVAAHI